MSWNAGPGKSFRIGAAGDIQTRHLRVKLDASAELEVAGAGEDTIGTNDRIGVSGDLVNVCLAGGSHTTRYVANGPIAAGATVEQAAAGKVATFSAGTKVGVAVNAASADGDVVEVAPLEG